MCVRTLSPAYQNGKRMTDPRDELLTTGQVAERFLVSPRTIARWADRGFLPVIRTLGGQRRYRRAEVEAIFAGMYEQPERGPEADT